MPEFTTQAEVDAHNATVQIQREAIVLYLRMTTPSEGIAKEFPLATLAPTGVLAPSGRRYKYGAEYLTNGIGVLIIPLTDRAVASSVLCPPGVWRDALNNIRYSAGITDGWTAEVLAAAQKILDGDK
jgi:hypothetical protein